eukprot:scaffold159386_cov22-Cyclotella_meneghiniana.AAC.1
MRYDAVLHYADEAHPEFYKFKLPLSLLPDPGDEEVTLAQLARSLLPSTNRPSANRQTPTALHNPETDDYDFQNNSGFESSDDEYSTESTQAAQNNSDSGSTDDNSTAEDTEDEEESSTQDANNNNNTSRKYIRTDPKAWKKIGSLVIARTIEPVPFEGENTLFTPKFTDEELASMKDASGDIRVEKVFEMLLPRFGEQTYFEFIAARMRNYMLHIVANKNYKPKFYKPALGKKIEADHVARFYGVHMSRMICGFPTIEETWSTREALKHVSSAAECMPKDAYIDMYRCMHFSDDWEPNENGDDEYWEDIFATSGDDRYEPTPNVAKHRHKFEHIEDGFNRRWKEVVNFGRWITADESRVAGWYNSGITIGPEPKPIRTGATIHSICVTEGELATFKLQCRVYGGKSDEGLKDRHENTVNTQKWVNLYDIMLDSFKHKGMCCTCDSAYSGDILMQISREEWGINMLGTCQSNRSGGGLHSAAHKAKMKVGSHECAMYQHNTLPLSYTMWADNSVVKTLSNFHTPELLPAGMGVNRRKRVDGVREYESTPVQCPLQQRDYSLTFHLIDKGNGKESKYDMGGQTKGHNWAPKLSMRYFNFGLGNAHTMYAALCKEHTPFRKPTKMPESVCILAHHLMQTGEPMRKKRAEHPLPTRDLTNVHDFGFGRALRSDAKGDVADTVARGVIPGAVAPNQRLRELRAKQKKHQWRMHQSTPHVTKGRCSWSKCPGLSTVGVKRRRATSGHMCCEECSAAKGGTVYLCNTIVKGQSQNCHLLYHAKYHVNKYDGI